MRAYGYSPARGVVRTAEQPEPAPVAEPQPAPKPNRRGSKAMAEAKRERLRKLASWRLHDSDATTAPFGAITAREAAQRLGVTIRTVERYKHELATGRARP